MKSEKNVAYYLVAVVIFIVLKFLYASAETSDLLFLLQPTNFLVGFFTGVRSVWSPESGYFYHSINIAIDKSCSGFNYWLLSFLLFTYLTVKLRDNVLFKVLTLPLSLLMGYVLTVFVNSSRIFVSIIVQGQTENTFPHQQHLIHQSVGIITNLTFLILAYLFIEKIITQTFTNEKLA